MANNNSSVVANLLVNIGANADVQQVTNAVKEISNIINKEIYKQGKKSLGLTLNTKSLERGEKDILALMNEIKKKGVEIGNIDSNGKFLKDANGKATALEKIFNKLAKQLVVVRRELDTLNPSALRIENSLRRARLASATITEREKKWLAQRERNIAQNFTGYPSDYFNKSASASAQVFMSKEGMLYESKNLARIEREKKAIVGLVGYEAKKTTELRNQNYELRKQDLQLQKQAQTTQKLTTQHGQLYAMARQYFNVWAVKAYAENLVNISAEFNMQRRALGVLINDQAKAVAMFNQIKSMALESPLTAMELTQGVKQLSAFDIETKNLMKDIKMLGDISSGTGAELSRLILAYGHTNATRNLNAIELRQFAFAGVPLLANLAKKYTADEGREVTPAEVRKRIQKREVSFEDTRDVLMAMTEEGGKFYNMQQQLAETTYGKIQKLKDAWLQGWAAMGDESTGTINRILDGLVKIAKNVSSWGKSLVHIIIAYKAVNTAQKLNRLQIEREIKTVEKLQTLTNSREFYATGDGARLRSAKTMITYYDKQISQTQKIITNWDKANAKMSIASFTLARAKVEAQGIGGQINIMRKRMVLFGISAKMVLSNIGMALKSFFTTNAPMLVITVLTGIISALVNASQAAKQLQRDLAEIDLQTRKQNETAESRFSELAEQAVRNEAGTRKREEALSKLNQLYGEVLPNEVLRIEYLKELNGQYDILIDRIKTYNNMKAQENKEETLRGNEKYKKAIEGIGIHWTKGELYDDLGGEESMAFKKWKDVRSQIEAILSTEVLNGEIRSLKEYNNRAKKLSNEKLKNELGNRVIEIEVDMSDNAKEFFEKIEEMEKSRVEEEQKLYSKQGFDLINTQTKVNKQYEEQIKSIKTGNDLITRRDAILKETAQNMTKALNTDKKQVISLSQAMSYLSKKMNADDILRINNIQQGTEAYNQTLQTMTKMKEMFSDLWDGVDIFSERSKEVLDIWKDSYITIATVQELLGAGEDKSNKTYLNLKTIKDTSKKFLDNVLSQEELQKYYGVSKEQVEELLKVNSKEQAQSYRKKYGTGQVIGKTGNEWADMVTKFLDFYEEGFTDEEKKKKGSAKGKSEFEKQKEAMAEWVAMWSKAKQDYENMQEMFAKDKSIEKMWEMWEEQFGHIQDNIQNVLGRAFEKDDFFKAIENNNSFTDLINEYIAYVRKAISRATDQKDKNVLSDFLYNTLIPKITDANRREIEKGLEKFIKEIDNMLDHTKARIDLYDKIFKTTGDSMLAYNIASSFNGGGTLNRMRESREILQSLVNEYGSGANLSGKSWVELYGEAEKLSGKIKDEYLKVLQEMRSGTEELITKALQGYEKMLSVEEKMMMSYSEYLRNVKEANENIEDEVTRNKVLEGLKRMYKQTELELQMESIKSSQFYIDLFNNINTAGVGSLSAMRKQLVFLSKESGLSARELKTLQDEIKKIDDRLKPKSYKITDIVKIPKKKEIKTLLENIDKATEEYNEQLREAQEKKLIYDKANTDFSEGKITRGEYDDARENSDMATEEAERLRGILDQLNMDLYEMESKHTKAWQFLESVLNEYGKSLQNVGEIGSSVLGTMDNFSKMVSGRSSARITAGLNAWNEAVSSIQSGVNAFKNVGSSVSDIASKFAKIREAKAVYQSTLAKEGAEAEATLQAQSVMTGAMATGYGAIAVAAVEAGIAIYKMGQAIHDSNIQKRIEKIQDQIDSLEKSITGINNVMKKLAGNSYYRKQAEQIEVYRKQMNLAQQQLQLEREKSKGGDKDTIKGYKNTIDDYKQKVIDAQEQLFQSFLGSDVNGYLKGIVDTFVQARIQGENTFNALKKSFGEMITSMIEDTIMSSIIQKRFEGMFEAIRQASDKGSLSTTDVSRISAAGMQAIQDANNDLTAMFPLIESMRNMFGLSSSVAGSYGSAVQGMSEQTAGTLGGYMGAMLDQMSTQAKDVSLIKDYVSLMAQSGGQTGASMMNEYQTQALNNLANIQANTLRNANKVDQLYNLLESMRTVNNSGNGSVYGWQIVQD